MHAARPLFWCFSELISRKDGQGFAARRTHEDSLESVRRCLDAAGIWRRDSDSEALLPPLRPGRTRWIRWQFAGGGGTLIASLKCSARVFPQTKQAVSRPLTSRTPPACVVINPEGTFGVLESTAGLWRRSIAIVRVTIPNQSETSLRAAGSVTAAGRTN